MRVYFKFIGDLVNKITLIFLGIIGVVLIIVIKSKSHAAYNLDSPIFFYTIAITTFQLSRLAGAMLYKNAKKHVYPYQVDKWSYEPRISFVIPCKNEEEAIRKTIEIQKAIDDIYPKVEDGIIN